MSSVSSLPTSTKTIDPQSAWSLKDNTASAPPSLSIKSIWTSPIPRVSKDILSSLTLKLFI